MNEEAKIREMLGEGKIDPDQAALLLQALRDSEAREENLQERLRQHSRERTPAGWRFAFIWLVMGAIVAGALLLAAGLNGPTRDEHSALAHLHQATLSLEQRAYAQAESLVRRAVEEDPGLPQGHFLLGLTHSLLYEQTRDPAALRQAEEAFQKARALYSNLKAPGAFGGAATLFLIVFFWLLFGVILTLFLILYNLLVKREERVNEAWAQVLTLYRRKVDLIPAVMQAVNAYSRHEQETLQAVMAERTNAKTILDKAQQEPAEPTELLRLQKTLDAAMGKIDALAEKYPDLKADAHYLALMSQLESTEDGITHLRMQFNQSVNTYNQGLRMFPANLVGALFHFHKRPYFEPGPA